MTTTERKVSRWGQLQPGDQIRYNGVLRTVTAVEHEDIPATDYIPAWTLTNVTFVGGLTAGHGSNAMQYLAVPATDEMRALAPKVTLELMLSGAQINGYYSLTHEVQHVEECEEYTDEEAATMAELVADLASRATIDIKLPEATS